MSSAWTLLEASTVSLVGNTSYFLPFLTHWLLFLYRKSRQLVTLTFSQLCETGETGWLHPGFYSYNNSGQKTVIKHRSFLVWASSSLSLQINLPASSMWLSKPQICFYLLLIASSLQTEIPLPSLLFQLSTVVIICIQTLRNFLKALSVLVHIL